MAKILLVEDNEMNREMLARRLERRGYQVLLATNGVEGVSLAQSEHPDLVLMDMSLPILDGKAATRQIKANPHTRNIPIIALTAHAFQHDREAALAAGCDDFAVKPVDFPNLLRTMESKIPPDAAVSASHPPEPRE